MKNASLFALVAWLVAWLALLVAWALLAAAILWTYRDRVSRAVAALRGERGHGMPSLHLPAATPLRLSLSGSAASTQHEARTAVLEAVGRCGVDTARCDCGIPALVHGAWEVEIRVPAALHDALAAKGALGEHLAASPPLPAPLPIQPGVPGPAPGPLPAAAPPAQMPAVVVDLAGPPQHRDRSRGRKPRGTRPQTAPQPEQPHREADPLPPPRPPQQETPGAADAAEAAPPPGKTRRRRVSRRKTAAAARAAAQEADERAAEATARAAGLEQQNAHLHAALTEAQAAASKATAGLAAAEEQLAAVSSAPALSGARERAAPAARQPVSGSAAAQAPAAPVRAGDTHNEAVDGTRGVPHRPELTPPAGGARTALPDGAGAARAPQASMGGLPHGAPALLPAPATVEHASPEVLPEGDTLVAAAELPAALPLPAPSSPAPAAAGAGADDSPAAPAVSAAGSTLASSQPGGGNMFSYPLEPASLLGEAGSPPQQEASSGAAGASGGPASELPPMVDNPLATQSPLPAAPPFRHRSPAQERREGWPVSRVIAHHDEDGELHICLEWDLQWVKADRAEIGLIPELLLAYQAASGCDMSEWIAHFGGPAAAPLQQQQQQQQPAAPPVSYAAAAAAPPRAGASPSSPRPSHRSGSSTPRSSSSTPPAVLQRQSPAEARVAAVMLRPQVQQHIAAQREAAPQQQQQQGTRMVLRSAARAAGSQDAGRAAGPASPRA